MFEESELNYDRVDELKARQDCLITTYLHNFITVKKKKTMPFSKPLHQFYIVRLQKCFGYLQAQLAAAPSCSTPWVIWDTPGGNITILLLK